MAEENTKMDEQVAQPEVEETPEVSDQKDEAADVVAKKDNTRTRKDRPTGSIHFGDTDFDVLDEYGEATWGEVCRTCCCHTPKEWAMIFVGIVIVCFFLYWFLFGLELLGTGAKVMTGCTAGALFGDDANPIAGLMVGILATVLLQSSSTTTSIIVQLVGGPISVRQGIYMVMGANIGTSVTNTIVAIGQMGDGDQLERAFAGATVHDMFNFMTVAILLPLEAASGYLYWLTFAIVQSANPEKGEKWEGPVKQIVAPLADKVIIANKKVIQNIAENGTYYNCANGGGFYPQSCDFSEIDYPTYKTCKTGLIACNKKTNECPAFFQVQANAEDDKVSGGVIFFLGIFIIFFCLFGLVSVLQKLLLGMSTRIVYKATDVNGYIAMIIGAGITIIVQSSSITTSTLTPLVGVGVLRLEQMYPLTLGANIGTTMTGIMAAMVSTGTESLQVALAHLFFNITGILIFYPIPFMRRIPIYAARQLGKGTRLWRGFPFLYIAIMFFAIPLLFLGLSLLFEQHKIGLTTLGSFLTIIVGLFCIWIGYWCHFKGGKQKCVDCFAARERRRIVNRDLPDDMDYLKAKVSALIEHTGLPVDEEDEDVEEETEELVKKTSDEASDEATPENAEEVSA